MWFSEGPCSSSTLELGPGPLEMELRESVFTFFYSFSASMCCVALPYRFNSDDRISKYDDAEKIQNFLYSEHRIEVPFKSVGGKLGVRISVHIYNELYEYEILADAVNQLPDDFLEN